MLRWRLMPRYSQGFCISVAVLAPGVGEALAEVAGRRADEAGVGDLDAVQEVIGAAALEGTDGVEGLDLQDDGRAEQLAERLRDELRRVPKDGVDDLGRLGDVLDRDAGRHREESKQARAQKSAPPWG